MVRSKTITVTANGDNGDNGDKIRFPLIQEILDKIKNRTPIMERFKQ